jgi:hypothetical protein
MFWSPTSSISNITPWSESASELYRPRDRRLSAKWLPTFCGQRVPRGQRDGSLWPYSRFSRQEPLLFYQVAPQLYSRGWVDPVPDPLLFLLVVHGNRTRDPWICSQELWPLDHRGGHFQHSKKNVISWSESMKILITFRRWTRPRVDQIFELFPPMGF